MVQLSNPSAPNARHLDDTIVVEDGDTICGDPHVALQACGTETECEFECLHRVFGGVGSGAAVGEHDRWIVEGGEALLLHDPIVARLVDSSRCSIFRAAN
jgi:hypothetical protein